MGGQDLRADGRTLIYISHRLEELYALCDACTIFRDGRKIVTHHVMADVPRDRLMRHGRARTVRHLRLPPAHIGRRAPAYRRTGRPVSSLPGAKPNVLMSRQALSEYTMPLAYVVLFAVLAVTVDNFFRSPISWA